MHILILNQTFAPDVAATGQLMGDLARHLVKSGHRVSVVTSRSFYGTDRRHARAYEILDGVEVHRLGGTAFGKGSLLLRLADFASFYLAAAVHLIHAPPPDVILALTSPPQIATLAMLVRQFRRPPGGGRVRFVYHVMDLYPDAAVESGVIARGGLLDRVLSRITARTLDTADAVVALGRDMRDRLLRVYAGHARAGRITVIPPWADGEGLGADAAAARGELARSVDAGHTFNVVYSGNLGIAHDVDTIVGAIERTRDWPDLRWIFIGGGKRSDALRRAAESAGWPHVRFLPFQPREALGESLGLADVHLVSQLPAFTGVVVPSKLFGILAAARPTVVIGPADAECARVVRDTAAGFVVANGDAAGLVARLSELRADPTLRAAMGARARAAFDTAYARDVACARVERLLQDVVDGRERGGESIPSH